MPTRGATRSLRAVAAAAVAAMTFPLLPAPAASAADVTYVVTFAAPPTQNDVDVLRGIATGVHAYQAIPAAAVVLPPALVPLLRNLPGVKGVWPNERYRFLDLKADQTIRADQAWGTYTGGLGYTGTGFTGAGIGIGVVDAGVDGTHPDLCGLPVFCKGTPVKTVQNVKFVGDTDRADPVVPIENVVSTDNSSGHGSHVAGIAAGYGTASSVPGKYQGVAPGASLVGLGTGEAIDVQNVLAGFDYALTHRAQYNIKVLNNSWGPGYGTPYDPDHPVNKAIDAAWDAGVSVVFGAGNDGTRTDSLNAFSVNPHAISVAGTRKDGHQAFFSSRGVPGSPFWHPTVGAPGENIVSVRNSTGFVTDVADASSANPDPIANEDLPYYANSNGTSMSSPHVAGVVALMQQASFASRGVYLTPQQVKDILQSTAMNGGTSGLPNYQAWEMGAGQVDAYAATQAAAAGTAPAYDDHIAYDVRSFTGTVGPAAVVNTAQFSSTFEVAPGAVSLEVTADWKVAQDDVDINVTAPGGAVTGTQLRCDPNAQPNGYSSFCSSAPNERLSFPHPAPGTWRVDVLGFTNADENVTGYWSAAYPDGTVTPAPVAPATLTLAAATPASVQGQPDALTATVRDAAGNPVPNAPVVWTSTGAGGVRNAEAYTASDGVASANALSDAPGAQTVTATTGTLAASVNVTWVGVTAPCPTCGTTTTNTPGKASGGGWFTVSGGKRHFGVDAEYNAGAALPGGSVSYDDHAGTAVGASVVERFAISGRTATFSGPATVNGATGYRYEVAVTDNGEPGRTDTFSLTLTRVADPLWSYRASGTLGGGNVQVRAG
jgi:serine protease AprX